MTMNASHYLSMKTAISAFLSGIRETNEIRLHSFVEISRQCISLHSSVPAMVLLFSVMPDFPLSLVVHLSVTKRTAWLTCHNDVLTRS